jgi:N-terminal acetyltransferase B complex catalytic subunit
MTTIRPFQAEDLFKFNHINLDPLTETYNIQFYMVFKSEVHNYTCYLLNKTYNSNT